MQKSKKPESKEAVEKTQKKKLSQEEYEANVIELAKQGLTAEKIGEALRKKGTHPAEYGKRISVILKEKNLYSDPELKNVVIKLERVKKHYEKNKQDRRAMREKDRIFSQLRKVKKYLNIPLK